MSQEDTTRERIERLRGAPWWIITWQCQWCGWANDNNQGPCRKCGRENEPPRKRPKPDGIVPEPSGSRDGSN